MSNLVSVIIPVYNAEKTIEKCVESIIFGQYRDIEVVLVNDCSKDNSWNICQSLSAKYKNVHSYQNKQNRGVSYTRNHGLKKAKGEYILFVDSDDWVSGEYVLKLLENAKKYKDSLVICGLHFYDNVTGNKIDYLWEKDGEEKYHLNSLQFFELQKKFHLQQLWNKIFHRDIIEKYNIRFDETQSMGEDFQFVLDYMEVAKCKKCVVLNEALYYYIRANNASLMSQFGLIENGNEYKRLEKLLKICGKDVLEIQQQYKEAICGTKSSYAYFITRTKNKTRNEKIVMLEELMKDGQASRYYFQQRVIVLKEKIISCYVDIKKFSMRVKGRVWRERNKRLIKKMKSMLKSKNYSIVSQNCIGGVFYHDMGQQFLSPTINLFFQGSDFVKLVLNLEYYMELDLHMEWKEEYPVGILGDIKVYFMHYQTCSEAKESWNRRKKRINWNKILVLSTDMEGFSEEIYKMWKQIKYPKILFSAKKWDEEDCVCFSKYKEFGKVEDLISKREFYARGRLIQKINNMM